MTRDDIIRMAREASDWDDHQHGLECVDPTVLERFAALVAAAEREACHRLMQQTDQSIADHITAAIAAEREACAALCDDMARSGFLDPMEVYRATFIADAIRARGAA